MRYAFLLLELTALSNGDLGSGLTAGGTVGLDGLDGVVAVDDLTENGVLAVQPWTWDSGDEELRPVGVWAGVGH